MESSLLSRVTMIKRRTLDVSDVHQRLLHVNLATGMVPFNQVKWWHTLAKPCSVSPILLRVKPVLSTACEASTCSARPRCLSGLGPHYRCPQPPPSPSSCPLDRLQSLAQARHSPTSQPLSLAVPLDENILPHDSPPHLLQVSAQVSHSQRAPP